MRGPHHRRVKRCRIVADTFRHLLVGFVDAAMEVADDLHDLRVTTCYAAMNVPMLRRS